MLETKQRASLMAIIGLSVVALIFSAGSMLQASGGARPVLRPKADDELRHVLILNGDLDRDYVLFDHEAHKKRLNGDAGCAQCHHLNQPGDLNSRCYPCHADMERPTPVFNHAHHERKLGGNGSCSHCHEPGRVRSRENSKPCDQCHAKDMGMTAPSSGQRFDYMAPGYVAAMHGLCLNCHRTEAARQKRPELAACDACHRQVHYEPDQLKR
jgi:hypothetical protein